MAKLLLPSASVDIRHLCGRKMENGELLEKRGGDISGRNQGVMSQLLLSLTSVDISGFCGRKMGDGGYLGKGGIA